MTTQRILGAALFLVVSASSWAANWAGGGAAASLIDLNFSGGCSTARNIGSRRVTIYFSYPYGLAWAQSEHTLSPGQSVTIRSPDGRCPFNWSQGRADFTDPLPSPPPSAPSQPTPALPDQQIQPTRPTPPAPVERQATLLVPSSPGTTGDILARVLARAMSEFLPQNIVVGNSMDPAAAAARVARSDGKGYSLLLMDVGMLASSLVRAQTFDPIDDFEPIGHVANAPMVLVARASLAPETLGQFIAHAKSRPNELTIGNTGIGSSSHLCELLFRYATDTSFRSISFKSSGAALMDLAGGRIDLMCSSIPAALPQIVSGAIKAYAVTSKARATSLGNVPTVEEAGRLPFEFTIWYALLARKGTPTSDRRQLSSALHFAYSDSRFTTRLAELDLQGIPIESFQVSDLRRTALYSFLRSELTFWRALIRH